MRQTSMPAVSHRSTGSECYALDKDTVVVNLRADKSVTRVRIISEDPFIHELKRQKSWEGKPLEMRPEYPLDSATVWTAGLRPKYKRLQYYFWIETESGEVFLLFENKLCRKEEKDKISSQCFKFPWINPSDVIAPPNWVKGTVWYQIFPERYCRGSRFTDSGKFRKWGDFSNPSFNDLYGGTLNGIREKLAYIKSLGIGGIYLTPIFLSNSNHKYNTFDYYKIDPDFGTEEDLTALVDEAHSLGIKIMLDAVFNHCGTEFFAWKDVCEKGRNSAYFDWFFINKEPFVNENDFTTADGRFFTFSFWSGMPKLNTNNPAVQKYFTDLCVHWARDFHIDGIRFDVGDEVAHSFLRKVRDEVKAVNPEIYLLGEIWFDSIAWLNGTEYDAVMNYPFPGAAGDFWRDETMTSRQFAQRMNYCRTLYPKQINEVMFNFLDTHDTARVRETCKNNNVLLQKLTVLMTMAGSPCIYYGTEIAMRGKRTPYNRSTMPWDEIKAGKHDRFTKKVSEVIRLRENAETRADEIEFIEIEGFPRVLCYKKQDLLVLINAGKEDYNVEAGGIIHFRNNYKNGILKQDGSLVIRLSE